MRIHRVKQSLEWPLKRLPPRSVCRQPLHRPRDSAHDVERAEKVRESRGARSPRGRHRLRKSRPRLLSPSRRKPNAAEPPSLQTIYKAVRALIVIEVPEDWQYGHETRKNRTAIATKVLEPLSWLRGSTEPPFDRPCLNLDQTQEMHH